MKPAQKAARKGKRIAVSLASIPLVRRGFTDRGARLWVREIARDLKEATPKTIGDVRAAHAAGFGSAVLEAIRSEGNAGGVSHLLYGAVGAAQVVSQRDYLFTAPFNRRNLWTSNRVFARRAVDGLADHMPEVYCTFRVRHGELDVVRLEAYPVDASADMEGVLEAIRSAEAVRVVPVAWNRGLGRLITWKVGEFQVDGWPATERQVRNVIWGMAQKRRCVLCKERPAGTSSVLPADARLRFYMGKDAETSRAVVLDAELLAGDAWMPAAPSSEEFAELRSAGEARRGWPARRERLQFGEERFKQIYSVDLNTGRATAVVPPRAAGISGPFDFQQIDALPAIIAQIEGIFTGERAPFRFLAVDVVARSGGGFDVVDVLPLPRFPRRRAFSAKANEFLCELAAAKAAAVEANREAAKGRPIRAARKLRRLRNRRRAFSLRSEGFTGRMARSWTLAVARDRRVGSKVTAKRREQAYSWGFLPATVERFHITDDNRNDFISERDYAYVQPLNGKYSKWVRDRVSARAIFEPFADRFETAHYHLLRRDGALQLLPLSEEAKTSGDSLEGLALFLAEHGPVMLVSAAWSGRVCQELAWQDGAFVLNGMRYTADEMGRLLQLRVREQFFVLIDPEQDDTSLSRLSSVGGAELRIVAANPDGISPRIAEASVIVRDKVRVEALKKAGKQFGKGPVSRSRQIDVESEVEAAVERQEHRADEGWQGDDHAADEDLIEEAAQESSGEVNEVELRCQIDVETGRFQRARCLVDGELLEVGENPVTGQPLEGEVPNWSGLCDEIESICRFAPQLAFVQLDVVQVRGEGTKIVGMSALPPYGRHFPFSAETVAFLKDRIERKRQLSAPFSNRVRRLAHNAKLSVRRTWASKVFPPGLVPYQSVRWIGDVRRDLMERNGIALKDKLWAYRHGFLSYRLPQYGITQDNHEQFISDFEYRWLRHINRKYKYWLEDKISIKYVAAEFNDSLPEYYFYTNPGAEGTRVVPMMDCPAGLDASLDSILTLARHKSVLALKPDEGSHGAGFYKLTYENGEYSLNGEPAPEKEVLAVLTEPGNQYLVTEFIQMHPVLAEIYPKSVNTVRMVVFKRDGVTPQIGNAYLRIGSEKSGYVDNTAQGGMFAQIDVESGRFGNAQVLEGGRLRPQPTHPDTGVPIEGELPNWNLAKRKVLEIAEAMPQLEYLGFDVAITPDGIKLPEINRSPDYPRIEKLTPKTTEYLLTKLAAKKREYGYDKSPPKTLVRLPKREGKLPIAGGIRDVRVGTRGDVW